MKNALWNYTTVCTCTDSSHTHWKPKTKLANFDSRAFVVPKEDVCNAFYWRQVDAIRNSISGYAQKHFSHKQLHKKNRGDMKEMLKEKGIIWEDLDPWTRHGWCVIRNGSNVECDYNIPNFSQDRSYIEKYIAQIEE
jgi:tRNA(His) 5'-end guanylyltransferase